MNVVIYARYSSHNQQETSIEGQLKVCHEFCERNNYTVIHEYIDRAISGRTDNRPDFLQMIQDSASKNFSFIVVYQLDRFSRNRYDSAHYKNKLKKYGVRVLSARENINEDASGILMESVLEGMAEYYSAELSQKVSRGMEINASKCLSTGGNRTLGFFIDKDKKFQIDPDTAPIVSLIFQMYADGKSIVEITEHLNAQGYKTIQNKPFGKNSIRNILCNKRYIGTYTYKDMEIPNGIPRIVSDELFNKVQEVLKKNKKAPARARAREEYLLTTKLFCGYCKEMMVGFSGTGHLGKVYRYYECKGARKAICNKKRVKKEYIEDIVVNVCCGLLTKENIDRISKAISKLSESNKDSYNLKRLKKQLADNERKHRNLINAVAECDIESLRRTFYSEILELESQKANIEEEIQEEEKLHTILTEPQIKFFLTSLKKGNADDIKYRKVLITTFINAIYLYDDKVTFIFNSGDKPITINDTLLSDIEANITGEKGLFIDKVGLPQTSP
ncbi:MAG: recombinase family protein [Lachnospira sp.]